MLLTPEEWEQIIRLSVSPANKPERPDVEKMLCQLAGCLFRSALECGGMRGKDGDAGPGFEERGRRLCVWV